jgi:hypothetical protein
MFSHGTQIQFSESLYHLLVGSLSFLFSIGAAAIGSS